MQSVKKVTIRRRWTKTINALCGKHIIICKTLTVIQNYKVKEMWFNRLETISMYIVNVLLFTVF